jgi:hypothetical protein
MKKVLAASVASLMLVAGVAAAASDSAAIHVGDRLGSASATTNQAEGTPMFLYLLGAAAAAGIIAIIVVSTEHHSTHHSVSP